MMVKAVTTFHCAALSRFLLIWMESVDFCLPSSPFLPSKTNKRIIFTAHLTSQGLQSDMAFPPRPQTGHIFFNIRTSPPLPTTQLPISTYRVSTIAECLNNSYYREFQQLCCRVSQQSRLFFVTGCLNGCVSFVGIVALFAGCLNHSRVSLHRASVPARWMRARTATPA